MTTQTIQMADRIRATYKILNGFEATGDWTSLARIFDYLNNGPAVTLEEFHAGLLDLFHSDFDHVNLVPESNQKSLTEHQRRTALWMGNQWKHLISITR